MTLEMRKCELMKTRSWTSVAKNMFEVNKSNATSSSSNSKRLGSMHGEQRVITGLSKEVKQKLFIRGCQHRSV